MWDGMVAGTWAVTKARGTATLRLEPFAKLPRGAAKALTGRGRGAAGASPRPDAKALRGRGRGARLRPGARAQRRPAVPAAARGLDPQALPARSGPVAFAPELLAVEQVAPRAPRRPPSAPRGAWRRRSVMSE